MKKDIRKTKNSKARLRIIGYSVAASVILLACAITIYLQLTEDPSQQHVAQSLDVPPGGDKAILTLANTDFRKDKITA